MKMLLGGVGGYSRFQVTGMIKWGQQSKPKKSLGLPTKPEKKSLDKKLIPKISHDKFLNLKNFQKAFNDITKK